MQRRFRANLGGLFLENKDNPNNGSTTTETSSEPRRTRRSRFKPNIGLARTQKPLEQSSNQAKVSTAVRAVAGQPSTSTSNTTCQPSTSTKSGTFTDRIDGGQASASNGTLTINRDGTDQASAGTRPSTSTVNRNYDDATINIVHESLPSSAIESEDKNTNCLGRTSQDAGDVVEDSRSTLTPDSQSFVDQTNTNTATHSINSTSTEKIQGSQDSGKPNSPFLPDTTGVSESFVGDERRILQEEAAISHDLSRRAVEGSFVVGEDASSAHLDSRDVRENWKWSILEQSLTSDDLNSQSQLSSQAGSTLDESLQNAVALSQNTGYILEDMVPSSHESCVASELLMENIQEQSTEMTATVRDNHLAQFCQFQSAETFLQSLLHSQNIDESQGSNRTPVDIQTTSDANPKESTLAPLVDRSSDQEKDPGTHSRHGAVNDAEVLTQNDRITYKSNLVVKRRRGRPRVRRQTEPLQPAVLDISTIPIASNIEIEPEVSVSDDIDHPVLELPVDLMQEDVTDSMSKATAPSGGSRPRLQQRRQSGQAKLVLSRKRSESSDHEKEGLTTSADPVGTPRDTSSTTRDTGSATRDTGGTTRDTGGTDKDTGSTGSTVVVSSGSDVAGRRSRLVRRAKFTPNIQVRRKTSKTNEQQKLACASRNFVGKTSEVTTAERSGNTVESQSILDSGGVQDLSTDTSLEVVLEVKNTAEGYADIVCESVNAVSNSDKDESVISHNNVSNSHEGCDLVPGGADASPSREVIPGEDAFELDKREVGIELRGSTPLHDISLNIPENLLELSGTERTEQPETDCMPVSSSNDLNSSAQVRDNANDRLQNAFKAAIRDLMEPCSDIASDECPECPEIGLCLATVEDALMNQVPQNAALAQPGTLEDSVAQATRRASGEFEVQTSVHVIDCDGGEGEGNDHESVEKHSEKHSPRKDDDGLGSPSRGNGRDVGTLEKSGNDVQDGSLGDTCVQVGTTQDNEGLRDGLPPGAPNDPKQSGTSRTTRSRKRQGKATKPKIPAKRGRKRGSAVQETVEAGNETEGGNTNAGEPDAIASSASAVQVTKQPSNSQKRKRGRPPKVSNKTKTKPSEQNENAPAKETPRKKRKGRREKTTAAQLDGVVNIANMRICDMITYNPLTNPMTSPNEDETQPSFFGGISSQGGQSETVLPVNGDHPDGNAGGGEGAGICAPRVRIDADGNIVLDEESMVIESTPVAENLDREVVFENANQQYKSSQKRKNIDRWSKDETVYFYEVLSQTGTDFTLMAKLFPKRSRTELKKKFKREEKINGDFIDRALNQRIPIAASLFADCLEETEEQMEQSLVVETSTET